MGNLLFLRELMEFPFETTSAYHVGVFFAFLFKTFSLFGHNYLCFQAPEKKGDSCHRAEFFLIMNSYFTIFVEEKGEKIMRVIAK